ncbi:MAG: SCO family protein [Gammaproteobacteria bacterium]|nr:SCO family protein [Gammaproteobacteria bacterium]
MIRPTPLTEPRTLPLRRWIWPAMLLFLAACSRAPQPDWKLTNVSGHLPDLAFHLTDGAGRPVTARDFRGHDVVLYFGYTHCPDACPLTMTHLHLVMQKLGPLADRVRILFVSVDPARDTPKIVGEYAAAFDPRAVGLTGSMNEIVTLAKRYRVAFTRGPDLGHGAYEVNHSSAIYVFDSEGRARLLASPANSEDDIAGDLRLLIGMEHPS